MYNTELLKVEEPTTLIGKDRNRLAELSILPYELIFYIVVLNKIHQIFTVMNLIFVVNGYFLWLKKTIKYVKLHTSSFSTIYGIYHGNMIKLYYQLSPNSWKDLKIISQHNKQQNSTTYTIQAQLKLQNTKQSSGLNAINLRRSTIYTFWCLPHNDLSFLSPYSILEDKVLFIAMGSQLLQPAFLFLSGWEGGIEISCNESRKPFQKVRIPQLFRKRKASNRDCCSYNKFGINSISPQEINICLSKLTLHLRGWL